MKHLIQLSSLFLIVLLASCGGKEKKEEKEGFSYEKRKKEEKKADSDTPVDLSNKGIGPITSLDFDDAVNEEMATQGKAIFNQKCTACHAADKRLIGPPMKGVYERRSPEWVMNMLLNPGEMLQKDPIAKALMKEYNNAIMLNQNLTEEEARALAEYIRTL